MKHYIILRRFSYDSAFGGCERQLMDWLEEIDYKKYKITLLLNKTKRNIMREQFRIKNSNANIFEFPFSFDGGFFDRFKNMYLLLSKLKPCATIFMHGEFDDFGCPEFLAAYLITRGTVINTEHCGAPAPSYKRNKLLSLTTIRENLLYALRILTTKKVLAVSNEVKDRLVRQWNYPPGKIEVYYHGVDNDSFRANKESRLAMRRQFNISNDSSIIISTSRLDRIKRLDRLINSFDMLHNERPDIYLLLCGDGPLEVELNKIASSKRSAAKIIFTGCIPNVHDYLNMSDIYVLPSDMEGFGIALIEAMSAGLLCVATTNPGPSELIKNGHNGVLCEKCEHSLFDAIKYIFSLTLQEKQKMSNNARDYAANNFDVTEQTKKALVYLGLT